jgi:hypothetical protein
LTFSIGCHGEPAMTTSAAPWVLELKARLVAAWVGKMLTTTLGITGFFVAYFWVLHNPQGATFTMQLTALDRLVPFEPRAMPLYLSLWFYVSLGPALLRDGQELARYGLAAFVLSAVGLLVFLFWPTATPDFGIDWQLYPSMAYLKGMDASANACPSLHVAFAVFTGLRLDRLLREIGLASLSRLLNLLWCVGIVYSTVAVRQHVALDAMAGAALGAVVALGHPSLLRRPARAALLAMRPVILWLGQPAERLLQANRARVKRTPVERPAVEWAGTSLLQANRARMMARARLRAAAPDRPGRARDRQAPLAAADPAASGAAPSRTARAAGRLRSG